MNPGNYQSGDVEPDWKKVERDLIKVGLKDGLSDGRDSNFQRSFDKGYMDGFANAYELGRLKYKSSICQKPVTPSTAEILNGANKGLCLVCTSDNNDVADVRKRQQEFVESSLQKVRQELNCP